MQYIADSVQTDLDCGLNGQIDRLAKLAVEAQLAIDFSTGVTFPFRALLKEFSFIREGAQKMSVIGHHHGVSQKVPFCIELLEAFKHNR